MNTKIFLALLAEIPGIDDDLVDELILAAERMTDAQRDEIAGMIRDTKEQREKKKEEAQVYLGRMKAIVREVRKEKRKQEEQSHFDNFLSE